MANTTSKDCTCRKCSQECEHKPGWFHPDQVPSLAQKLNIGIEQLFENHLSVDWWAGDVMTGGQDVFVLSPRLANEKGGGMFPANPLGLCHWYKDGKCEIHLMGKPAECAFAHHDLTRADYLRHRLSVVKAWAPHQSLIARLLRRRPSSQPYGD